MWTTVYVAMGLDFTNEIEEKLSKEGFKVKSRFFTVEDGIELYEILGPEAEAKDILKAMYELEII